MKQPNDALSDYLRLREKLSPFSSLDKHIKSSAAQQMSHRHHYIPQYFIEGFTNDEHLLWIYDKQKDTILKKLRPSRSLFYEENRNSVDIGAEKPLPVFEEAYSVLDKLLPAAIRLLRSETNIAIDVFIELVSHLNVLVIDLFWRNINTDFYFDLLLKYSKLNITVDDQKLTELDIKHLQDQPGFKQLVRMNMARNALKHATQKDQDRQFTAELIVFPMDQLCLGDMPFLFESAPIEDNDLVILSALIPISKRKLLIRNIKQPKAFTLKETQYLNAILIDESSKYICAANKDILASAVNVYKNISSINMLDEVKKLIFSSESS